MQTLFQDIRFGCRMLLRNPGFTIAALLCLGLGIGGTTAMFSVVNAVLLRPLPFKEPDRLVKLLYQIPKEWNFSGSDVQHQLRRYLPWKDRMRTFESAALFGPEWKILSDEEGGEDVNGFTISEGFFEMLGSKALLGRTFLKEECAQGSSSVIILSYDLWRRRFNSEKTVIGKTVKLQNVPRTIVGVMPREAQFYTTEKKVDFWIPPEKELRLLDQSQNKWWVIARLKPGVDLKQSQAEMDIIVQALVKADPISKGTRFLVMPLLTSIVGERSSNLFLLLGATLFVLLIASANVASLVMVRMISRQHEIMIRLAMGSGRLRLIRQLLTEALLLAFLGGALGMLIAYWSTDILSASAQSFLPRLQRVSLDSRVLGFALGVTLLTGLAMAVAATIRAFRMNVSQSLSEVGRSMAVSLSRQRLIRLVVISEISLTLILLTGAGLMMRSLARLMNEDLGFKGEGLLKMDIGRPVWDKQFGRQLLEQVGGLPGVEKLAIATSLPFGGGNCSDIQFSGKDPKSSDAGTVWFASVSPDYFKVLGIPLVRGRAFAETDTSTTVVVVNEKLAAHYWPGQNPIGKRFKGAFIPVEHEIVGVVGNTKRSIDKEPELEAFLLYPDGIYQSINLVMRTKTDPFDFVSSVRREVRSLDKNAAVSNIQILSNVVAESVAEKRFTAILLSIFAAIGLILAIIGIYGVMANSVAQRTHDIGVRIAMGAQRRDIIRMVVGQGLVLVVIGVAIGLAGAFALTRLIASQLYGVKATDPWTFAGVTILLAAVALLACYIPARRATKIDPMEVLRWE